MMTDKYFCRNCHGLRNHKVLFQKELRNNDPDPDYSLQFIDKYLMIECTGCETISFLNIYGDTSMIREDIPGEPDYYSEENIYPYYLEKGKELEHLYYLPKKIHQIYLETIACFKSKSYILTAGGFRAIIEAICNHLKIKKANLSTRIDLLFEKGILTEKESKRLHAIRFVGNDALHEIETPSTIHLLIVLETVNHILENLFIQDQKIKSGLDSIIDDYDEFLKIVRNKMSKDLLGKTLTLSAILGKGIRLVKNKKSLLEFETKFKNDIKNKKVEFMSIDSEGKETVYKIEKVPDFIFGF